MLSLSHPAVLGLGGAGDESGGELVKPAELKGLGSKRRTWKVMCLQRRAKARWCRTKTKMLRQDGAGCKDVDKEHILSLVLSSEL